MDAHNLYGGDPHSTEQRRNFYITYLEDVVPNEVTIHPVPNHDQPYDLGGSFDPREEIQLWYAGKLFMTGVVGLGHNNPSRVEEITGHLAYIHWKRQRIYLPFDHQAWGMFTGLTKIRFCSSRDGMNWNRTGEFHPLHQVREVVAYFEQELARVSRS